ncbi:uncharacterized protein LOC126259322 isoform X1 [Schistocerca nitens]|uniref:uncharacterized protein LOC126259322 isoform X1 n=1 Tax=Schistocerca nitens TaxID=7011 RepID=UPI002119A48E|nr:uncharacterized protein LOC126259322 isoform X1 [Schistocerca nitens]XP_049811962.1 uncharacterized protein LOC126259322 isoform X1 [Schistocerca nitens]
MDYGEECEQLICTVAHCRKVYPEACSESLIKTKRLKLNSVIDAEFKINKQDDLQEITSTSCAVDLEKCMSDVVEMCATHKEICKKLDEVTNSLKDISDVFQIRDKQMDMLRLLRK